MHCGWQSTPVDQILRHTSTYFDILRHTSTYFDVPIVRHCSYHVGALCSTATSLEQHAGVQAYSCTTASKPCFILFLLEIAPLVQDCSRHLLCGWNKDWNFVTISKHLLSWKCKGTTHYSQANQKILLPLPWFLWVLWVFRFQTNVKARHW